MSSLINQITDFENIQYAYRLSQGGKGKYRTEAMEFALNETANLVELQKELKEGRYEFGGYFRFMVYEPKERVIHAPRYKDKLVQLAINNVLKHIYKPTYIYDSYACIDGKGTHKAVDRVSAFMRQAHWKYGQGAYIIKLDISKFFYSIDRDVLKRILPKKIKCKETLSLLYQIIDSARLIDQVGIPLGNLLSQLFANVLMNEFDQFCKRRLSIKYYIRYADDAIAFVENKTKAQRVLWSMQSFLEDETRLNINPKKTKIFPIDQGVNAYGFKIYRTHRLLRDDSKRRIKRKAKKMRRLIAEGLMTAEKAEQILNSWQGHAKQGCNYNFIQRLLQRNDYITQNHKGVLKIKESFLEEVREHVS